MKDSRNMYGWIYLTMGVVACLAAGACATIGNPSGGARDEMPPRYVKSNPAPGAVNFRGQKVTIEFDELINIKDAFSKVVVSPPSKSTPRVTSQGHRVTVNFPDTLEPNTTYTINFADAIEDNNEGNPLENFAFTFSTGETVDSLKISGMVAGARDLEPMQGKLVGIYRVSEAEGIAGNMEDGMSNPGGAAGRASVGLPDFFTRRFDRVARTDERGRFSVEGIAPGRYRIFALDDINGDFRYSSSDEQMAFLDTLISPYAGRIVVKDSIYNMKTGALDTIVERERSISYPNDILLRNFTTVRKPQFVNSYSRTDSTRLSITFAAPQVRLPELALLNGVAQAGDAIGMADSIAKRAHDWYVMEKSATNDTIVMWLKPERLVKSDTLRLAVKYLKLDSAYNYVSTVDTLRFTTERPKSKGKSIAQEQTAWSFPGSTVQEVNRPFIFMAEQPLAALDTLKLHLEEKVDSIWRELPPLTGAGVLTQDTLNPRLYRIGMAWKPGVTYRLRADSLAGTGIYGLTTAKAEREFNVRNDKEYCSIKLNLTDWPSGLPGIVELLNGQDTPVAVARVENGHAYFPFLQAGKYYARVIWDINGNGEWDGGDYLEGMQPEPAFYYPKQLSIKQNWNKEESWAVFSTAVDEQKPYALLKNKPKLKKGEKAPQQESDEDEDPFGANMFGNGMRNGNRGNERNPRAGSLNRL